MDLSALHEYIVKVSVFLKAAGPSVTLELEDSALFSIYAAKLAEQGHFTTAAKYNSGDSQYSRELRDRLYRSKASQSCLAAMGGVAPEFPFTIADVKKSRVQTITQATNNRQHAKQSSQASNGYSQSTSNGYSNQTAYSQGYQQNTAVASVSSESTSGALPAGWIALQDPSSGNTYYANQATGEVTWEKPQAAPESEPTPNPQPTTASQTPSSSVATSNTSKNPSKLVSKYGDGFVTSASHPELASQYGNIGTRSELPKNNILHLTFFYNLTFFRSFFSAIRMLELLVLVQLKWHQLLKRRLFLELWILIRFLNWKSSCNQSKIVS
jgi:protein transport protein SEC31